MALEMEFSVFSQFHPSSVYPYSIFNNLLHNYDSTKPFVYYVDVELERLDDEKLDVDDLLFCWDSV